MVDQSPHRWFWAILGVAFGTLLQADRCYDRMFAKQLLSCWFFMPVQISQMREPRENKHNMAHHLISWIARQMALTVSRRPCRKGLPLVLAFCGVMSALDLFGMSFAKNDLYYIENDAEELPPDKKHLLLILNVVDDVTKVNVKTNLMFWDDFVYDDKGHKAMLEKLSKCRQVNSLTLRYATTDKKEIHVPVHAFSAMTNLTSLSIKAYGCQAVVSSLKSLSRIPLEEISLMNVALRDIGSLRDLPKLTDLTTNKPEIFANAPDSLESLKLDGICFPGVCDLSRFTNLTCLALHDVGTSYYVAGIEKMQRLENLEIIGPCDLWESIEDDVQKCSHLRSLTLYGGWSWSGPRHTEPLGSLPLERIDFRSVPIRFLRGLEACPLEDVRINQCPVRDIDCLCAMPRLKFLDLHDTGVMSANRDELKKKFPNLEHFECSKADMSLQYEDW